MLDDKIVTVRLDADIRRHRSDRWIRRGWRFISTQEGYFLFVGTIEPRKNHLLAFGAWRQLIKQHGSTNVPKLVCRDARLVE